MSKHYSDAPRSLCSSLYLLPAAPPFSPSASSSQFAVEWEQERRLQQQHAHVRRGDRNEDSENIKHNLSEISSQIAPTSLLSTTATALTAKITTSYARCLYSKQETNGSIECFFFSPRLPCRQPVFVHARSYLSAPPALPLGQHYRRSRLSLSSAICSRKRTAIRHKFSSPHYPSQPVPSNSGSDIAASNIMPNSYLRNKSTSIGGSGMRDNASWASFLIHILALMLLNSAAITKADPLYKGVTCFCSLQKCQMTNNLCTSYFGCYQMDIVLSPGDTAAAAAPSGGGTAGPSTYTAFAACIESRSQNNSHCGPEELYRQSSPNSRIKCCTSNLCNDIDYYFNHGNKNRFAQLYGPRNEYDNLNGNVQAVPSSSIDMRPSYGGNSVVYNSAAVDGPGSHQHVSSQPGDESLWTNDFWFRIAVITVPITGAVILLFLIVVAIKLLRQEDVRRHKMLAQQKIQTLNALHRGCTEHYCHLTGSVTGSQSGDADVSKCDKYSAANKSTVCQYSPTRQVPALTQVQPFKGTSTLANPSHMATKILSSGNLSPYAKCDTIQTKPVVTRPPDICECHSPGIGPAQIMANPRSSSRNFYNMQNFSSFSDSTVYRLQNNAMFATEHV